MLVNTIKWVAIGAAGAIGLTGLAAVLAVGGIATGQIGEEHAVQFVGLVREKYMYGVATLSTLAGGTLARFAAQAGWIKFVDALANAVAQKK